MTIQITIETDNAAFDEHLEIGVSNCLKHIADSLRGGYLVLKEPAGQVCGYGEVWGTGLKIIDDNGNWCGKMKVLAEPDQMDSQDLKNEITRYFNDHDRVCLNTIQDNLLFFIDEIMGAAPECDDDDMPVCNKCGQIAPAHDFGCTGTHV